MTIDQKTVAKIAHLARMKIADEEQKHIVTDFNKLFDWIAQLDEVNVANVEPLTSVNDLPLRWREDVVTDGGKTADILANAPAKTADFFTVPKVIE